MKVQLVTVKGFFQESSGCWKWTPEIVMAFDPIHPELTEEERDLVRRALWSQMDAIRDSVIAWDEKDHAEDEARRKREEQQRLDDKAARKAREEEIVRKDAELRAREESLASCPHDAPASPGTPDAVPASAEAPADQQPTPDTTEPGQQKLLPGGEPYIEPGRDAHGYLLSVQPRLGNFPPGYDAKTGRWEACPYCGSQDVTHPRLRGEGDWQGCKPCNAGLKRDGTIYPLKDDRRVGPKAKPQTH